MDQMTTLGNRKGRHQRKVLIWAWEAFGFGILTSIQGPGEMQVDFIYINMTRKDTLSNAPEKLLGWRAFGHFEEVWSRKLLSFGMIARTDGRMQHGYPSYLHYS